MMGRNTCNFQSGGHARNPVRGAHDLQILGERRILRCPPAQFRAISSAGQPKTVVLMSASCPGLIRSCDPLTMGFMPTSTKGASATGPAMVNPVFQIRDQAGIATRKHNPLHWNRNGVAAAQRICWDPWGRRCHPGCAERLLLLSGRNATGDTERISKPRISFSPPR